MIELSQLQIERPVRRISRAAAAQVPPVAALMNQVLSRRTEQGLPTFNMNQGLVRMGTAAPKAALENALREGRDLWRMGPVAGLIGLRERIAEWRGANIIGGLSAQNVMITCGANNAHLVVMSLLSDPGDLVVCPRPYFFNHANAIRQSGRALVCPRLRHRPAASGPTIALETDELEALGVDSAKYVILSNPHNPTGARFTNDGLAAAGDWCGERGITLVLDESYCGSETGTAAAFLNLENTVIIGSLSKSACLGDLRLGYIIASEESIEQMQSLQDNIVICPSLVAQDIACAMLDSRREWAPGVWEELGRRSALLDWWLSEAGLSGIFGREAVFKWIQTPPALSDEEFVLGLAESAGIIMTPGAYYGCRGFVRASYGMLSDLTETNAAGSRLAEFVRPLLRAKHA